MVLTICAKMKFHATSYYHECAYKNQRLHVNTIKSNIKKFVKTLLGINNSASLLRSGKFNLSGESTYHIKNFGNQNPGLVFYVIAKSPGSGFFSNISYVINHLKIADNLGFIP